MNNRVFLGLPLTSGRSTTQGPSSSSRASGSGASTFATSRPPTRTRRGVRPRPSPVRPCRQTPEWGQGGATGWVGKGLRERSTGGSGSPDEEPKYGKACWCLELDGGGATGGVGRRYIGLGTQPCHVTGVPRGIRPPRLVSPSVLPKTPSWTRTLRVWDGGESGKTYLSP